MYGIRHLVTWMNVLRLSVFFNSILYQNRTEQNRILLRLKHKTAYRLYQDDGEDQWLCEMKVRLRLRSQWVKRWPTDPADRVPPHSS